MKNLILAIFAIALIESITSCKKTEDTVDAPFITIWTPTVAQNFVAGDTIHFTGNAGDSEDLHEGKLEIVKASNDSVLAFKKESVHAVKSYDFDARFSIHVAAETNAIARATYEDHDGNRTVKEVNIVLKP